MNVVFQIFVGPLSCGETGAPPAETKRFIHFLCRWRYESARLKYLRKNGPDNRFTTGRADAAAKVV